MTPNHRDGKAAAASGRGAAPDDAKTFGAWTFELSLRLDETAGEVARARVRDEDLDDARSETWFEGFLRKGQPGIAREAVHTIERPVLNDETGRVVGFLVEATGPGGRRARRAFGVKSLQHVASRGVRRLLADGVIASGDIYFYDLEARRVATRAAGVAHPAEGSAAGLFSMTAKPAELRCLTVPLPSVLFAAREVGKIDPDAYPVFFTDEAMERAERFSRAGADRTPPVETGAALLGSLCACPETGEMFAVVHEAVQVLDAAEGPYSLAYSGRTWARIEARVAALRARPGMGSVRLLGQAHGHNFLPENGAPPCELCAKEPVCGRSTAFLSDDDIDWSRAVFARQPWHVAAVFGLNARREPVHAVFTQRGGRLRATAYRLVSGFEPQEHAGR